MKCSLADLNCQVHGTMVSEELVQTARENPKQP